jgi:DNA (cytosine-5)-methyltransferase 1
VKINQLDLFSGIGGFHLGFERAGFEVTSYFSEVDPHAIAVYKNQFKNSTYVGSVTDVRGEDLPAIDLITFGSPCQDFSLAGKRQGMAGQRSSLILEAIRLIKEKRPRVFIWENVKGTFSSNSGEDFAAILKEFTDIGGYRLEWQLLNTSWFLPQNRERIYLVGYSSEVRGDWPGAFPIGENNREVAELQGQHLPANTILQRYTATANGTYIGERELAPQAVVDNYRIRRLTPIECERLQGFPDNHTAFGDYDGTTKPVSNTQRYRQCGNAVTVDVVQAIAIKLKPIFE